MKKTANATILTWCLTATCSISAPAPTAADDASFSFSEQGEQLVLDLDHMKTFLSQVPLKGSMGSDSPPSLRLPLSDGTSQRFKIVESPIMGPELAEKFSNIRTFSGWGMDDPSATISLALTPTGISGMILSADGITFIDPIDEDKFVYKAHTDDGVLNEVESSYDWMLCNVDTELDHSTLVPYKGPVTSGENLSVYRVAIAATGEYAVAHGGISNAKKGVATTLAQINSILNKELSVHLEMADNSDKIVFPKPSGDPYPTYRKGQNNWPERMLAANQKELDKTIKRQNYDIGLVLGVDDTTKGQGIVGGIGIVCNNKKKGMGLSSARRVVHGKAGYRRFLLVIAHEIGHQLGANHSFNGDSGVCKFARAQGAAYEPGSGSTIMSYASRCASLDNVQSMPHAYYHTRNFQEIRTFIEGFPRCGEHKPQSRKPPIVKTGESYAIPFGTPFRLKGVSEGVNVVYTWEQFDRGGVQPRGTDNGKSPLFRSVEPIASQTRWLPNEDVMASGNGASFAAQLNAWELLPLRPRNMKFRLTARDNMGGVAYRGITIKVRKPGYFRVLEPRAGDSWVPGGTAVVRWAVKGTNKDPFKCNKVDIKLSTVAGADWFSGNGGISLRSDVPNDGSQVVNVPQAGTTGDARVMVSCMKDNIFYNISPLFGICNSGDVSGEGFPCDCIIANDKIQGEWYESEGSSSHLFPHRIAFRKTGPAYGTFEGFSSGHMDYSFTEECDSVIVTDASGFPVVTYSGDLPHPNCLMLETGFQRTRYYCKNGRNFCPPGCGR